MDIEPITRWSGIPRVFDPGSRNHRIVLLVSVIGGIAGFTKGWLADGGSVVQSLALAVGIGGGAFISWGISRELDPDNPDSGLLAALLAIPVMLALGAPSLLAGFWMILILRILNRSTGLPAKPLDSLGVLAVAAWLAYDLHPSLALFSGLALLVDSWLPDGHSYHRGLGFAVTAAGGLYWITTGADVSILTRTPVLIAIGLITILYLLTIGRQGNPQAPCDFVDRQIDPVRVRAARLAALIIGHLSLLLLAERGLTAQAPLWSAIIALIVYSLPRKAKS